MKIAYLVLAHTDNDHLLRLVKRLTAADDEVFIHIDQKSKSIDVTSYELSERVHVIAERRNIAWAGFEMVEAELDLIEAALSKDKFQRLILLSGQDYPLLSAEKIKEFMKSNENREFIRAFDVRDSPEHYLKSATRIRMKNHIIENMTLDKVLRKAIDFFSRHISKRIPEGVTPCFGSQWWAITNECASHILHVGRNDRNLRRFYKTSFAPDEQFVHTIVKNSNFLSTSGGIEKFQGRGTYKMANLHLIHPSLSKYYSIEDLDDILKSDKLFIRKVSTYRSSELLDKIDLVRGLL